MTAIAKVNRFTRQEILPGIFWQFSKRLAKLLARK